MKFALLITSVIENIVKISKLMYNVSVTVRSKNKTIKTKTIGKSGIEFDTCAGKTYIISK